RGGGLTGALGGAGGQSAFGAKAGDVFTRITVVVASFWILLCILAVLVLQDSGTSKLEGAPGDARGNLPSGMNSLDGEIPAADGQQSGMGAPADAETELQLDADSAAPAATEGGATESTTEDVPAASTEETPE
ncbi:MAG: preprotein translocase subunit SecG, partial [Pirellulaceae bacterium]